MANGYIIIGDGTTANHGLPNSFNPTPPLPPITYSSANYIVSFSDPLSRPSVYAAVFKAVYGVPLTFSELDLTNEPVVYDFQAFYPTAGGSTIYFSYTASSSGAIKITTFDLTTGTWGSTISSSGPAPNQSFHRLVHRTNGDWVVVYNTFSAGQGNVFWSKWNGSSWSSAVKVSTVTMAATDDAQIIDVALNEATGDIAIYWDLTKFSESYNTHHKYLTVLSGSDVLGTNYNWQNNTETPGWETDGRPLYNSAQDQWEYPLITAPSDAPTTYRLLALAESAPASNPATTTIVPIVGGQDIDSVAFPRIAIDQTDQKLYFLWANNFNNTYGNPAQVVYITRPLDGSTPFQVTQSTNGGGDLQWVPSGFSLQNSSGSVQPTPRFTGVFYDESVDTLTPVPAVTTSVIDLAFFSVDSGIISLVMNPLCAFQYGFVGLTYKITLTCPIGNTGALTVIGGIPPFTFSLLTPLPPGYTFDTATGIVSGSGGSGTFYYAVKVVDSMGNVGTT